jgi:rhamnosyltransferase
MAKDTEDTYGDGSRQKYWKHCFSMALSSVRRSVWEQMPFNEQIQYSEDIEWTWRARQRGYTIRYVADSIVTHSHNYTLTQFYRRQLGEGRADAAIFDWDPWQRTLLRYSLLPYARQVASDWKYCLPRLALGECFYSPVLRMAQLLGRRKGFQTGWREAAKRATA